MTLSELILAILALAVAGGTTAAYFWRSRGKETIELLQTNIQAYKDSEKLKDQKITYLEGQLVIKDETIKRILKK